MRRESRSRKPDPGLSLVAFLAPFALAMLALALGCAGPQRFDVRVSGLAGARGVEGQRYVLLPADAGLDEGDLQFLEFARIVELALADRGFVRVQTAEDAQLSVLLGWSVGDRETRTIVFPSSTLAQASYYPSHRHSRRCGHRGAHGYGSYYAPIYSPPTIVTVTTVNRLLSIEARALEVGKPPRRGPALWSTTVESRGSSDDLRRVFPVLVGAASSYLGTDTGQRIETTITEDDERVLRLKSARAESGPRSIPVLEDVPPPSAGAPSGTRDEQDR